MTTIQRVSTGYQTLKEEVRKERRKMAWKELLLRNSATLDAIGDIVKLACLWDDNPQRIDGRHRLRLEYIGDARNQEDARKDLARIMRSLRCLFDDLKPDQYHGSEYRPRGHYEGVGKCGRIKVRVEMDVPWLPDGCTVQVTTHGTYQRAPARRYYSVICPR